MKKTSSSTKKTTSQPKETQSEKIARLKEDFLKYLAVVPIYKFASMSVGRSEDQTMRWRNEDPDFAYRCEQARSAFVGRTLKLTKPEFQLERSFPKDFAPLQKLGNPDGSPIQFSVSRGDTQPSIQPVVDSSTRALEQGEI
jgi:hypothetical protein